MQHASNITHLHKITGGQSAVPGLEAKSKLLDQLREALRSRHYSRRTEQTYCHEEVKSVLANLEHDLTGGWGRVLLPDALNRKYPNAPKEWRWQWVFPRKTVGRTPRPARKGGIMWMSHWFKRQ